MSYTEIHRISKAGYTKLVGEIQNAHRGAMAVWTQLEDKYLPPHYCYGQKTTRMISFIDSEAQKVWELVDDPRLSESERICLLSTFDNVMVFKPDIPRLCKAFREFPHKTSLPEQADIIEQLMNDRHCYALCWNQTSVNADIPPEKITTDSKYWNLFEV